jgi:hypothetical protein
VNLRCVFGHAWNSGTVVNGGEIYTLLVCRRCRASEREYNLEQQVRHVLNRNGMDIAPDGHSIILLDRDESR